MNCWNVRSFRRSWKSNTGKRSTTAVECSVFKSCRPNNGNDRPQRKSKIQLVSAKFSAFGEFRDFYYFCIVWQEDTDAMQRSAENRWARRQPSLESSLNVLIYRQVSIVSEYLYPHKATAAGESKDSPACFVKRRQTSISRFNSLYLHNNIHYR